ncbi:ABC transporter substrate-binding protein [Thermodesulforhabdus norvegica]|uniref:Peptide/nickel transport system substrate-binding protein n=1 Tax=Thermodesulforhabdus norvegica TaxID=39841 RepID=A0A1I4S6T0_9BACT|nr:ABC transporter substrate-binding protein [Thermodesulforhabdus norvegica]SFM60226.1 peptide/nickel transport system substrate-binding protein [Thermodesulforhabdus norvegica]
MVVLKASITGGNRKIKSSAFLPVFLLLCVHSISICAGVNEGTLIIGIGRNFYEGPESATFLHGSTRTWEALVDLDSDFRPVPWLAQSWSHNRDYTEWKFTLRKNVRFHNGDLLTADHVIANIKRLKLNPKYDPLDRYGIVEKLYALDDLNILFLLKRSCLNFPQLISYYGSPILHPGGWDAEGKIKRFIATGPYRLVEVRKIWEESIVLERNDRYWGRIPPYARVIFRSIPDPHARLNALLAGTIDAILDVGGILPHQKKVLIRSPGIAVKTSRVATTHYLIPNNRAYPFSNEKFRRWFASSVDRELVVETIMEGHGRVAYDPYSDLNCRWSFSSVSFRAVPFPEEEVLPQIDKPVLILLHAGTVQRWPYREIAEYVASILRSKGLKTEIFVAEKALYFALLKDGSYNLTIMPFTLMTGDPCLFYSAFLYSKGIRNTGWKCPCVDMLIDRANATKSVSEKRVIYRNLQKLIATHALIIPLFHEETLYAYRKSSGAIGMDALFRPFYEEGA